MKNILILSILISLPGLLFAQGYSKIANDHLPNTYPYSSFEILNDYNASLTNVESKDVKPKKRNKIKYHSNNNSPRSNNPLGINIIAGGPALIGVSIDYFITPFLNIEAGGGYYGIFSGIKYHLAAYRNDPWTPFFGIQGTYAYDGKAGIYIPGGFHFIGRRSFSFLFEFALWIESQEIETNPLNSLEYLGMISLKAGYRF